MTATSTPKTDQLGHSQVTTKASALWSRDLRTVFGLKEQCCRAALCVGVSKSVPHIPWGCYGGRGNGVLARHARAGNQETAWEHHIWASFSSSSKDTLYLTRFLIEDNFDWQWFQLKHENKKRNKVKQITLNPKTNLWHSGANLSHRLKMKRSNGDNYVAISCNCLRLVVID